MSTERAESDGRQQHKPGSDDITANKTRASTTKGPLPVYLDLPIVFTSSAYQAELFLAHSIRNVITYRSVARRREGKVQQGKKRKQRDKWKCSLVGKKKTMKLLDFRISHLFSTPNASSPVLLFLSLQTQLKACILDSDSHVGLYIHLQKVHFCEWYWGQC